MKAIWPVNLSCEVLGVSVSGYFEHQRRQQQRRPSQPGARRLSDEALLAHMRAIHAEVHQVSRIAVEEPVMFGVMEPVVGV
jgi:hypothetical protein